MSTQFQQQISRAATQCAASGTVRAGAVPTPLCAAPSTVDPQIVDINRQRKARRISHAQLCGRAGVHPNTWYLLRTGKQPARIGTMRRLTAALAALTRIEAPAETRSAVGGFYRLAVGHFAGALGLDAPRTIALATDFATQKPNNPEWLAAARVRQLAMYLTCVELQVENATLAAIIGCSRNNVRKARLAVEDRREDAATDALLERVARLATGRD